jgi:sulfocyanin
VTTTGTTVHLTVIAGWNMTNAGFNFDGGAHGQLVVTVPLGDKIEVTYKNNVPTPHNVIFIPYTMPLPGQSVPPAFPGAVSPRPQFRPGAAPGSAKPATFSFVASKAGKYMMICGVPGHALAGMWDTFVISPTAKTASAVMSQTAVTSVAPPSAPPATMPNWVTTAGNVVHLTIIAGWNNNNAGFNFNGGAHGQMVVTVPLGAKVMATYQNKSGFHDVVIVPYQTSIPTASQAPAFPGAASPRPQFRPGGRRGSAPGGASGGRRGGAPGGPAGAGKPQTFSFVASKAGTYRMICGVPGHALAGMWDTFVVSPTAKVASITFKTQ